MRKLTKSRDRVICGVCGGFAKFLDCDPTVVRFITLCCMLCGYGILLYFLAALIMPNE